MGDLSDEKQTELAFMKAVVSSNCLESQDDKLRMRSLAHKYPCHIMEVVDEAFSGNMQRLDKTILQYYRLAVRQVNVLYTELLIHFAVVLDMDLEPDASLIDRLEPLLLKQNQQN